MAVTVGRIMLLTIAGVSVLMDLHEMKVQNSWIVTSLMAGFFICIGRNGCRGIPLFVAGAAVPLVILGGLFYFRMLGSGDIKLFCALGGVMGPVDIVKCIGLSFFFGAIFALMILITCRLMQERILYFLNYLEDYIRTGKKKLKADKERTKAGITGVEIAARIIKECKPYCQGVHIMALGWESKVPELLKQAGI